MHALKPIFSATRLARFVRYALLWLAKYGLFVLTDTPHARRHVRVMRWCVGRLVLHHAIARAPRPLRLRRPRDGASCGFQQKRNLGCLSRALLAPLRRSLRRGDALENLCALFSALWFIARHTDDLLKRMARGLMRLAPLILTHAFADDLPAFVAPSPAAADSS